jgi:DDE superfamily endonuclease/Helix-turn-helix of DDE superfamily endonuclease
VFDQDHRRREGLVLSYPASLPLSKSCLVYVAGLIGAWRQAIGSPWRRLCARRQALLVLAYLFKNETFEALADGFGISTTTAWRYVQEGVGLLAGQAPSLTEACWQLAWSESNFAFIDGTAVPIDRIGGVPDTPGPGDAPGPGDTPGSAQTSAEGSDKPRPDKPRPDKPRPDRVRERHAHVERRRRARLAIQRQTGVRPHPVDPAATNLNRLYYSGKHKRHVVNIQALIDCHGQLAWVSHGLPGQVQDLAAAHAHGLIDTTDTAGLTVLADLGYVGASPHVLTGYRRQRGRRLNPGQKTANKALASIRAKAEHGLAPLKRFRILQRARCCPRKIGHITKAIHTLLTRTPG